MENNPQHFFSETLQMQPILMWHPFSLWRLTFEGLDAAGREYTGWKWFAQIGPLHLWIGYAQTSAQREDAP